MKTLYLMRHAKSSWKDISLKDFDRPLNDRGKLDAPLMGEWFSKQKVKIDKVYCSNAKRTRSTCKKILKYIDYPKDNVVFMDSLYLASLKSLATFVNEIPNDCKKVLIIGHNYGISELHNYYTNDNIEFPTAAVSKIHFELKDWKACYSDSGITQWYQYPKALKQK